MHKKLKFLKNLNLTLVTTYLAATSAFISFTGSLSAGYVRDGDDDQHPPQRLIQVVLGTTDHNVDAHPDNNAHFVQTALGSEDAVREHMKNLNPPISGPTRIQFWHSKDEGTRIDHTLRSLSGAAGAQANAYTYAISHTPHANQIVPANVTFELHEKND